MTFEEAKLIALDRWNRILNDYPEIEIHEGGQPRREKYSRCGFCQLYARVDDAPNCEKCALNIGNICENWDIGKSLYWQICRKLQDGKKRGLKPMIMRMIEAIEKAEERKEIE